MVIKKPNKAIWVKPTFKVLKFKETQKLTHTTETYSDDYGS